MLHDGLLLLSPGLKLAIAGILLLAAGHDIMTRTVPNWMPLLLSVLSAALAAAEFRLVWGLGFGLTVFVLCFIFWWRGWMAGGDATPQGTSVPCPARRGLAHPSPRPVALCLCHRGRNNFCAELIP